MYWFTQYLNRLQQESLTDTDRKAAMNQVNPKYVLRNYMSQLAIEAAEKGDYSLIEELHLLLKIRTKIKMNTTNGSLKGQIGLEKNRKLHAVLQFLK
jgi:uncharacterized protein YdiU (UPF0061 family)